MRHRLRIGACVLLVASASCLRAPLASFSVASVEPVRSEYRVVQETASGRACKTNIVNPLTGPRAPRYDLAVENALEQAPGADALIDTTFFVDEEFYLFVIVLCSRVEGQAIRTGETAPVQADAP